MFGAGRREFSGAERTRLRRESSRGRRTVFGIVGVLFLLYLPFSWTHAIDMLSATGETRALSASLFVSLQTPLILWQYFCGVWGNPAGFAGAMLELRRCPACGYRLGGGVIEADACTVCAECGAAWQVSGAEETA
jgi:hypothetical protein